jgi:RimJ/RimL family protein N-acetyltransferase
VNASSQPPGSIVLPQVIEGRFITLRPVSRADFPAMFRWRVDRHNTPSALAKHVPMFEQFTVDMDRVLRQTVAFLVVDKASTQAIGYVQAYNLNLEQGWCYVLFYLEAPYRGSTHAAEAQAAFLDQLFETWGLRKVYADVFEFNADSLKPAMSGGFVEEACLRQHLWLDDRYWDLIRFALPRESWLERREQVLFLSKVGREAAEQLGDRNKERARAPDTEV